MNVFGAILGKHGPLGLALVVLAYLLMRQADENLDGSRGTRDMLKRAQARGIPVKLITGRPP